MTQRNISVRDANLILSNTAKYPTKGSQCNASCAFYPYCANSNDFGACKGFMMINGSTRAALERTLGKDNLAYIQNSYNFIERALANGDHKTVDVITRDISGLIELTQQPTSEQKTDLELREGESIKTIRGFDVIEIKKDRETYETSFPPNPRKQAIESEFPDVCSPSCVHRQCPYHNESNYGKKCLQLWSNYENEKMETVKPKNINEILLRSMNPDNTKDTPNYKSPLSSSNIPTNKLKPPSIIKRKEGSHSLGDRL